MQENVYKKYIEYRWIQWNIQAQLFHPFCIFLGFLQHVHLFRCRWGRLPAKVPGGNSMPLPDTGGVYILEAICTQGYWLDPSFFREPTVMTMSVQQQRWWSNRQLIGKHEDMMFDRWFQYIFIRLLCFNSPVFGTSDFKWFSFWTGWKHQPEAWGQWKWVFQLTLRRWQEAIN